MLVSVNVLCTVFLCTGFSVFLCVFHFVPSTVVLQNYSGVLTEFMLLVHKVSLQVSQCGLK